VNVAVTPTAADEFAALPRTVQVRVMGLFERLQSWPEVSGAKPLRGELAGRYRLRTGDYRLQFHVAGDQVIVEKIGHRDDFYDE